MPIASPVPAATPRASQGSSPSSRSGLSSPRTGADQRFTPGALLNGRYRIVSRLGKGGMGEVYRADDLRLDEPVALKFLPEAMATDLNALARFHEEVRIARQVTHPNVCRVYDIGEVNGQPFLSMQYIDGEDLGSLLRRIGRLPPDTAIEFARKICAGLAAAHAQGVLHRDLKPANVMVDARGQVLIMDFGLAGVAETLQGAEIRNGTPAYMAPEQLTGREVTIKSDIYALGLVLYEMFTGKPAFQASTMAEMVRLRQETAPQSLTTLVRDVDPLVERVILRCLAPDPRNRPASALAVTAALPGGDPLAAALAAGETPSPEMVASAGENEGLKPWVALSCLIAVGISIAALLLLWTPLKVFGKMPLDSSPDVLAKQATDLIKKFGYTEIPADHASGFYYDNDYLNYLSKRVKGIPEWDRVLRLRPLAVGFWYRQSPRYLAAQTSDHTGSVTPTDPPKMISGMVQIDLDVAGRLTGFEAVPPQLDTSNDAARPADWAPLFAAAGLDLSAFHPAAPQWTPLAATDIRAAWTGNYPGRPDVPIRVEAASWRGKPVYFQIAGPWTKPDRMQPESMTFGERADRILMDLLVIAVLACALVLARMNARAGRGDSRGAVRLGAIAFSVDMLAWISGAHHVPTNAELSLLVNALGDSLFYGVMLWALYLAIEPFVRRRWPQTMIGWSRILMGRFRDPLVGRDILLGVLLGLGYSLLILLFQFIALHFGDSLDTSFALSNLNGLHDIVNLAMNHVLWALSGALGFFLMIFLLRTLLRRQWLAALAFILICVLVKSFGQSNPAMMIPIFTAIYGLVVFILMRFGLLSLVIAIFILDFVLPFLFTINVTSWYGLSSLFGAILIFALAFYGFHVSLAGRKLLDDKLMSDGG